MSHSISDNTVFLCQRSLKRDVSQKTLIPDLKTAQCHLFTRKEFTEKEKILFILISSSYRTVPSTIKDLFFEFFYFYSLFENNSKIN